MWQQKSFENEEQKGILYLVPTPIGNLEDMSYRAVRILKEADLIAAEDTRNTKKLLHYFEIDTQIVSYHEHNKESSGEKLIQKLKEGVKIALVSDAGMPAISDPGYELVSGAISEKVAVVPLPGANAALTSLIASGLSCQPFYFYGFLHRNKREKLEQLEALKHQQATLIFYESPHRLKETLTLMEQVFGSREIALCRELTKKFEEFIRGSLQDVIQWANEDEIRGEFCLIVQGSNDQEAGQEEWWTDLTMEEHVNHYISVKQLTSKEAVKQTAKDRGLPKREVYQAYHIDE
ncbi:16S rRNA (cytidine(1402)-2'-O)-methyltransferase [Neobacillus kokaensis]|uniref:Ribosomal RNA small subunit methyltransferase I n=1 Tax=Neobacillus kokaensis TaxID=2759023 RepID=A0ABQ3N9T9_9BACI|nr:16S rRNA (cytidine(1402)-2'-O)-methyltransferase [Neobacillus kokaensis]GHI00891.1 ribosomal RNA small subunit methyltransferase I [Neobacillus kokaensis]